MDLKEKAKEFAIMAHDGQLRKSEINKPMIVHPIGVAKILEEYGCDDNVISAGFLHDVVEDTKYTLDDIKTLFGSDIAGLVDSASEPNKLLSWEERKQHTINEIKEAPLRNKLVVCSDKIDNVESLTKMLRIKGMEVFNVFKRDYESQLWYFDNVYESLIFNEKEDEVLFVRLRKAIDDLKEEIEYQFFLENEIFENNNDIYKKLKDLHQQKYEIRELKQESNFSKPIIIEFSGTPRTGKTSIINNLEDFFKKSGFKVCVIEEFMNSKYYKNELYPASKTLSIFERNLLIADEMLLQLNNMISRQDIDIILFDRGIFDRCIWMQRLLNTSVVDFSTNEAFRNHYLEYTKKIIDILVLTYADNNESLKRDYINSLALEERKFLNMNNIEEFNEALLNCKPRFKDTVDNLVFVDTTNISNIETSIYIAEEILDVIKNKYLKTKSNKNNLIKKRFF